MAKKNMEISVMKKKVRVILETTGGWYNLEKCVGRCFDAVEYSDHMGATRYLIGIEDLRKAGGDPQWVGSSNHLLFHPCDVHPMNSVGNLFWQNWEWFIFSGIALYVACLIVLTLTIGKM